MAEDTPTLYTFNVKARWRNRTTGKRVNVDAGTVVEFDDGDWDVPGERASGALSGTIDGKLAEGLFRVFDPATAGDPKHMSRDELLHVLRQHGHDSDELPHNADANQLRPMVMDLLATAASAPPRRRRRQSSGGGA